MAVQVETRTIGDVTYRVTQLTALKGRALFARLIRFVGPSVAAAVGSGNVKSLLDMDVGGILEQFSSRVTDEELGYFCDVLGSCTEIVGDNGATQALNKSVFDIHFAGRLLDMFKWMGFALEVNFADFLSVLKRIQGERSTAPASPVSPSQPLSTGTSGGS